RRFVLMRPTQTLQLGRGEAPRAVAAVLERLRVGAEGCERGGQMGRLADGEVVTVELPWRRTPVEQCFTFQTYDVRATKWRPADCPHDLVARVLAARGEWELPKVAGIVTFPVMRPSGTIIEQPGYDAETGLLYLDECP